MTSAGEPVLPTGDASGGVLRLEEVAQLGAGLFDAVERDDRFAGLKQFLGRFCGFQNFIVYLFDGTRSPVLLGTSVPELRLNDQMADFVAGLFLLDPFVLAAQRGRSGLVRLREIMPEGFFDSEFFRHHYRYTDVCDELRYIVPLERGRSIHVFVEREAPSVAFSADEYARLSAVTPLVTSFVKARSRWMERVQTGEGDPIVAAIDLQARIRTMSGGTLTARECEVVECMLKGHSAKSIASLLDIEEGTVTNHKRSIYYKLDIHSMGQLFDMFLRSLAYR